jgi:hypothetical protein
VAPASRRYALRMAFERWRRLGLLLTLTTPAALACGCSGSSKESAPDGGGSGGPDGSSSGVGDAMHGGDSPVTGDAGGGDAPGPTTPTVSSWVGTNVDADLPYADITHMLSAFNTAAAQLDANGYPVAGASGQSQTDLGFELPTGTYDISYVGAGTLAVSGIGALVDSWQTVNGEQRAQIKITGTPGSFGHSLTLGVTNGASQTVTNIHIYLPGIDYDATNPFNPAFLSALTPFRATRFMGWMQTNNSKLANWADRPASASFGASLYGVPYELIAELANQTGKDTWINIPEAATSSFITSFAAFMAQNLDFTRIAAARQAAGFTTPYQLILENSNETWNTGFSAYNTFLTAASSNPTRYPGTYAGSYGPSWMTSDTDLMKVGQYEADRLVTIAQAFQQALQAGGHADAVAPVLSGWALGAGYSDDGLAFIQKNYGTPSQYVKYVALAPYFATADDTTTGSLSTLFPAMVTNIMSMGSAMQGFAMLSKQYGVDIAAYESGQSLSGTTNETIKHLAQFDVRMEQTYQTYLSFWQQSFGNALFMHFNLAGTPGLPENIYQYGFWGSLPGVDENLTTCGQNLPTLTGTEMVSSLLGYCPKYAALAAHVPQ